MGTSKMDSSAVYALFEELKQKIDELGMNETPSGQMDSSTNSDEIISLIEELKVQINQQQFSPEQIKDLQTNMAQYSAYSLGKVNDRLRKVITELKALITPINRNSQLKDNDLKYRYIKSTNGITLENLCKLEDIFQYNRDRKLIREIKKEVEEYEREVQKAAKEIESKRLKTQKKKESTL